MDGLGVELAGVTGLDQGLRIGESRGPVETLPECLPRKRPRGYVAGTYPFMNFSQQRAPLFQGNAAKLDPIFPSPIEIPIYQDVHLCLVGHVLGCSIVFWQSMVTQVAENVCRPRRRFLFHGQDRLLAGEWVRLAAGAELHPGPRG